MVIEEAPGQLCAVCAEAVRIGAFTGARAMANVYAKDAPDNVSYNEDAAERAVIVLEALRSRYVAGTPILSI